MQCKLTVVCADAGYGKTTLVGEFCNSAGVPSEWCSLTAADRDVARLAGRLEECLRSLAPNHEALPSAESHPRQPSEPNIGVHAQRLQRQAARLGPETAVLVLDDYHEVDTSDDVNLLISSLIDASPDALRLIVLSRGLPHLPLSKLRAKQELCVLGEQELALTKEETFEFFSCYAGPSLDDAVVELVQQRTEGWAAGIAMVSQSLRYGREDRVLAVLSDPVASAWLVYDYLADEVFDRQPAAIQQFLMKTSILELMSAPLCDHLLGTSSSQTMLLSLTESGLFITSTDLHRQTFRYHQLFHQFLRQKLSQLVSREDVEALHVKAAQYYEKDEQWDKCFHHYVKAGNMVRAAEVVESVGEWYILSGFIETVEYWLGILPESILATRPWLLALRGRLSHMSVRNDEALELLERALRLFHAAGDEHGQAWTAGEIGYVVFRRRELRRAVRQIQMALTMAKQGTILRSQLLVVRAQAQREIGALEDSLSSCREALHQLALVDDQVRTTWCRSRIGRMVAHAQMEMGNLKAARRTALDALDFCTKHHTGEYEETWARAQLGAVLWACGEFGEAVRQLDHALSLSGRVVKHQHHVITLWLGNSLRDSGQHADAKEAYSQSALEGELEAIFLEVLTGQDRDLKMRALDLYDRYHRSESVAIRSTAEVILAIVLRECREAPAALTHIREAVSLMRSHGFRLRLASALLHQAGIEYDLARLSEARGSLARALEIAAADGYYHFFWWDPRLVGLLCQKALAEDMYSEYISELSLRRLDRQNATALVPLLNDRRESVRRRAHRILSCLMQEKPQTAIDAALASCGELRIRSVLSRAIEEGVISPSGVQALRSTHRLSWREVEIVVEYYLKTAIDDTIPDGPVRKECAERLGISENTLRCHVNKIRQKLALPAWVSREHVIRWADKEGLLPASCISALDKQT